MRTAPVSPHIHAGSACVETLSWNTNVRGEPGRSPTHEKHFGTGRRGGYGSRPH
jgi:hypothetical protein